MTRELTKQIQSELDLIVDGVWGQKTSQALIDYQESQGLIGNGLWDVETEELMFPHRKTIRLIKEKCAELDITKPEQVQYIIATAEHETAGTFKAIKEYGGDKYLSGLYDPVLAKNQRLRNRAKSMGNTEEGDGVKYCGRGLVQLTWKNNYQKYTDILGIDLVNEPDLALDTDVAVSILVHGMKHGVFTGKKLDDYISDQGTDFIGARRIINGTDKANHIASLACKIKV